MTQPLKTERNLLSISRYDAYKDSGIEWLGEVPAHWAVKRIKDITLVKRGASPRPIDDPVYFDEEGEYSWVRIADLTESDRYLLNTKEKLSTLGASLSVKRYPGNFILSIAGTVGKPIITKIKCCIHDGFVWFPTLKINPEFLYYIFSTGLPYQGLGKLGTQLNLNTETVGLISISTPSASEIERIVQHLDTKITQIDRQIDLLSQKATQYGKFKQSLINETVTRGLDKTVPMKDSGVEWVGEVPAHWEVKRVKEVCDINKNTLSEKTPASYEFDYVDIGSVTYGAKGYIKERMTFGVAPSRAKRIVRKGDTIVSTVRTYLKAIASIDEEVSDLIVSTGFAVISPRKAIMHKYCSYLLTSNCMVDEICALSTGVSYPATNATVIGDLFFLIPPLAEQQAIAIYLDEKTAQIDRIVTTINNQINKLKELRKTLINDVVTGKIKVVDERMAA